MWSPFVVEQPAVYDEGFYKHGEIERFLLIGLLCRQLLQVMMWRRTGIYPLPYCPTKRNPHTCDEAVPRLDTSA